jgi:hypothetical protein
VSLDFSSIHPARGASPGAARGTPRAALRSRA